LQKSETKEEDIEKSSRIFYSVFTRNQNKGNSCFMKTITQIIAGAQILFPINYDIQKCFEEYPDDGHSMHKISSG
jgi:hypothetical protein